MAENGENGEKWPKMGLIDLISPFRPNSSTFDKLDFSLI